MRDPVYFTYAILIGLPRSVRYLLINALGRFAPFPPRVTSARKRLHFTETCVIGVPRELTGLVKILFFLATMTRCVKSAEIKELSIGNQQLITPCWMVN